MSIGSVPVFTVPHNEPRLAHLVEVDEISECAHNEYIFRRSPYNEDDMVVMRGSTPKYNMTVNPPMDIDARVMLYAIDSGTEKPYMVAAATYNTLGKGMKVTYDQTPDVCWTDIDSSWNHKTRKFKAPRSGRGLAWKTTSDSKLGCSQLSSFDQKLVDEQTGEVLAMFLWNTDKISFTAEKKRATFRWFSPLTDDEEIAALIVCFAIKERIRKSTMTSAGGFIGGSVGLGSASC